MTEDVKDLTKVPHSITCNLVKAKEFIDKIEANDELTSEKKFQLSMDEVRHQLKLSLMHNGCTETKYKETLRRVNNCVKLNQLDAVITTIIEAGRDYRPKERNYG